VTGLERSKVVSVARPLRTWRGRWLLSAALLVTLLTLALLLVLTAFREQVLTRLGESLVVTDPLERADLIYVLAGDFWGSRVLLGANLGSQGWAPRVIMAGGRYTGAGDMNSFGSDLAVDFAVQHGYPRNLFVPLRLNARSTIDEASAMGPIFHRLGAKRIILVTSNFHSRRTAQVFRLYLPEFDFRVEGSVDDAFDPHAWWKKPQDRRLLFSEYQKMIGTFLVRFHLAGAGWLRRVQQ
jgi:uncharacterized SAM-binding protein YcdF (DUF218 family)